MASDLKLGYSTGHWAGGPPVGAPEAIAEAERLGFDSLWCAEAYGSDVLTPLAWWGANTNRLRLGTSIMQMSARTPAAAAMAAMTLDHLSGGRFILGLGVSGPQVGEGWYGQPFGKPLARTREYIAIVRSILAREGPVTFEGDYYTLPYPDGTGLGKPLKSSIHPLRSDVPIFLGAEGPKNIALAGELCDGWLALFFSPHHQDFYREALSEGFAREGARRSFDDFEIAATVPVIIDDDVERAADALPPRASRCTPCTSAGWARATAPPTPTSRAAWATTPRSTRSPTSTSAARRTRPPRRSRRRSSSSSR